MARLTNKDRESLRRVLAHLERAHDYIQSERVHVCIEINDHLWTRRGLRGPDADYTNKHGKTICSMNKQVGSDLAGLEMGISALASYLTHH